MEALFIYLVLFAVFFAIGVPIALALSVSAIFMLLISGMDLLIFAQKFVVSMDNFGLIAMFFFIFAGEIMNGGGMTRRIVSAVSKRIGRVHGGLAMIAVISCALFAAINGSAIATSIAVGAILYPAMVEQGYSKAFSAAVIAAGGIIGSIIPPSIPMIVYGSTTGDSIGALFSGGVILGALICIGEIVVIYIVSKKRGYGGSSAEYASENNIEVRNVDGANKNAVAEMIIAMMLIAGRRIDKHIELLKIGKWKRYPGLELSNTCVGIIGLGNIGRRVVELLKGFSVSIKGYDLCPDYVWCKENNVVISDTINKIFEFADYLILTVPLTETTKNTVNKDTISLMKKEAVVINASRGGLVNDEDLTSAVNNGRIYGAALDAFTIEPLPAESVLRESDIVLTPHLAASSIPAVVKVTSAVAEGVIEYVNKHVKQ